MLTFFRAYENEKTTVYYPKENYHYPKGQWRADFHYPKGMKALPKRAIYYPKEEISAEKVIAECAEEYNEIDKYIQRSSNIFRFCDTI